VLLSLDAAAVSSLFDLTAGTPTPVSARGIADGDNDHHGSDARHESNRLPNLPCIPRTSKYARSNTSHALAPVTAPVTNSSSLPRKKKLRSSRCRYGMENSSSDVSAFGSPPVENRKSPFLIPKLNPRGSETLSPVVDDLAGKNSPVTLSASCLNSVQLPILAGMNQFSGPIEIPCNLDGVFVGQLFLPQVQIPADHPRGEVIRWAAATLCTLPAYKTRSDYIEHQNLDTCYNGCIQSHPPRRSCGEVSNNPIGCK